MRDDYNIKISIVVPVYNAEGTLEECIRSVQKQTMREWEILCTDDGSTDASHHILKRMQQDDARVCIFEQTNQGAGAARNLALKNAKGEFVCFLDADDYWMDERALEKLYKSAVIHNVNICGGQFYTSENGVVKKMNVYGSLCQEKQGEKLIKYTDYQYDYNYTNYIYSRKLLLDNHIFFPQYRRFEDPPFFVKAMSAANTFCIIDVPFYCYRVGYKEMHYTENVMADQMQGMLDNLFFSGQEKLKRLHRLTYYRIIEICNRGFKDFVLERNAVLFQKLKEANNIIRWEWLEETCKIRERTLKPLSDMPESANENILKYECGYPEKWHLPVGYLDNGSRVALYGAGDVGRSYFRQIQKNQNLCLCAWADKNYKKITESEYELISPESLLVIPFDYVIIGVAEIIIAMEIMDSLIELGVPAQKIVWDIGR